MEEALTGANLIDGMAMACTLLEKHKEADGEGGWTNMWADGATFNAAVVLDRSMNARRGEAEGVTDVFTVTTAKGFMLDFHDVFRRESDGKVFRVTTDGTDAVTPEAATFAFSQVSAEEWELPR